MLILVSGRVGTAKDVCACLAQHDNSPIRDKRGDEIELQNNGAANLGSRGACNPDGVLAVCQRR
jgi:hypothetical protein